MVVLKSFGRGATVVKWSPCETRFAVGSGGQQVQVCAYEEENNWWIGKPIREGIEHTINDIAFHPSSLLIAAGGCDKRVCVYVSIIKSLDSKAAAKAIFGDVKPPKFGECIASVDTQGWVNGVAFSPRAMCWLLLPTTPGCTFCSWGWDPVWKCSLCPPCGSRGSHSPSWDS